MNATPPPGKGWRLAPLYADCPRCEARFFFPCRSLHGHKRRPHRCRVAWVRKATEEDNPLPETFTVSVEEFQRRVFDYFSLPPTAPPTISNPDL